MWPQRVQAGFTQYINLDYILDTSHYLHIQDDWTIKISAEHPSISL